MNHETFREWLPLYALGTLDGEELREFERYVSANRERCEPEIAEFEATASMLALAAPAAQPSSGVLERVMQAIEEETQQGMRAAVPPPENSRFNLAELVFRWFPWSATAALAATLAIVSMQLRNADERYEQKSENYETQLRQLKSIFKEAVAEQENLRRTYDKMVTELLTKNRQLEDENAQLIRGTEELRLRLDNQGLKFVDLARRVSEQNMFVELLKDDPNLAKVDLADPEGKSKATAKVYWHKLTRNGLVVVSSLDPVPKGQGKSLELWTFCGKKPPVGTTLFWTDETGYGAYPLKIPAALTCADKFAVTLEPTDDQLLPAPQGPVVLVSN